MRMGRQLLPFEQAWRWTADFAERGARALAFDRPVPYVARVVLLAAVYFVAAKLAFLAAIPPGVAGGTRSGYALLLAWAVRTHPAWTPRKIAEGSLLVFLLSGVMYAIFGAGLAPYIPSLPLTFAILPFIIWGAFRFRQREVATVNVLVCAMAVGFTLQGSGPFAQGSLNESLLLLLAFMCTVVTTGLVLNAVIQDRGDLLGHQARGGTASRGHRFARGRAVSGPCDRRGGAHSRRRPCPLRCQEGGTQPGQDFFRREGQRQGKGRVEA